MRVPRLLDLRASTSYRRRRRRASAHGTSEGGSFGHPYLGRVLRPRLAGEGRRGGGGVVHRRGDLRLSPPAIAAPRPRGHTCLLEACDGGPGATGPALRGAGGLAGWEAGRGRVVGDDAGRGLGRQAGSEDDRLTLPGCLVLRFAEG